MSKHRIGDISWEEPHLFDLPEPDRQPRQSKKKQSRWEQYGHDIPTHTLEAIWHHYVDTFRGRGCAPQLTIERKQLITMSVNQYGIENTKRAITGCSRSNWHMGNNPAGKRYTSIELILRDSEHIEQFVELTVAEETKGGFLDDEK